MKNKDNETESSIRRHQIASLAAAVVLVAGIGLWASTATLSGAVVASGSFVVESYAKKVQHPTGGVVGEILVNEGDRVRAGDIVLRVDSTKTRANLAITSQRLDEIRARVARLVAERDDLDAPHFPDELTERESERTVAEILYGERRLFTIRRDAMASKLQQLSERITQYEHEMVGMKAQEVAFDQGMAVLESEITTLSGLREKGLVSNERLNGLKTQLATFGGERGERIALQAQIVGKISEVKLQMLQIVQDMKAEVGLELREAQAQIAEYVERKVAAEDDIKRVDMIAPASGVVHQLATHTVGGVISPADVAMLIVPDEDSLTLEVGIQPKDIDHVHVGQKALVRLSAFNQRTTPELNGTVSRVGADLTKDDRTGSAHYVVRISLPAAEIAKIQGLQLIPGMPAEAFIATGERPALSYLLKPLSDQISRAFREE
ncbi:HlyD family type I secretion periplasmic adaptor subunit [Agrobacterium rubi]|nr:HlyD family type I secretion periplasmic adaptor subunit [Agrobacterium rubi]NTF24171.1 HlyD family type I secretion periplasmic adaptor subunit [Agrobacterium rubi]